MDLYLTSAEPGLTLQEMIDCDIKSGIDFETGGGGFSPGSADALLGPFDLAAMTELDAQGLDIRTFEPLFDPLVDEEESMMEAASRAAAAAAAAAAVGGGSDHHRGQQQREREEEDEEQQLSPVASWMNLSTMSNFNLDAETSVMVNPSAVLPSPHYHVVKNNSSPPSSPKKESPFRNRLSSSPTRNEHQQQRHNVGGSIATATTQVVTLHPHLNSPASTSESPSPNSPSSSSSSSSSSLSPLAHHSITTTTAHTTFHHHHRQQQQQHPQQSKQQQQQLHHSSNGVSSSPISSSAISSYQTTGSRLGGSSFVQNRAKSGPQQQQHQHKYHHHHHRRDRSNPEEKSYPKPAYSYACLIALALKNSITGSLPVSEIYSFMCEHFPYFRTAPNGWKNSVRHNLSLNKCFEKIEKPVVSGSNQRKGCLWALNPQKAHKMDEEVQKWSKKDLQGIRDAMTCPEVLESLEKGEMKFEATSGASSCSEDEEEEEAGSDPTDQPTTLPPIKVISSTPLNIHASSRAAQNGFRSSPKPNHHRDSSGVSGMASPQQIMRTLSSSPEPEFILPDSTMSEINIQANGALIDDFGNEITLDGDLSILNPRGSSSSSSGTNLILRKVNASSPLRRSNFVYSTPNSSATSLAHQNNLNRLVLTNAKLSS